MNDMNETKERNELMNTEMNEQNKGMNERTNE